MLHHVESAAAHRTLAPVGAAPLFPQVPA